MKRKILAILMVGIMTFTLVSCSKDKDKDSGNDNNPSVTTDGDNNEKEETDKSNSNSSNSEKMTVAQIIKFNEEKIDSIVKLFNDNGFPCKKEKNKGEYYVYEGDSRVSYVESETAKVRPGYSHITYSLEERKEDAVIAFSFNYDYDYEKIKNGEFTPIKASDLMIDEIIKLATGKDMPADLEKEITETINDHFERKSTTELTMLPDISGFKQELKLDDDRIVYIIYQAADK